ncbi:MAG: hypothetical protein Tsb0013_02870 [Phycisphaerales bacterium]
MTTHTRPSLHTPSALAGALLMLGGMAGGAFLVSGGGAPRVLAASPEAGDAIPAIELDADTTALVVDSRGMFFVIDANARAFPVRFDESALRNVPGEEILQAR